MNVLRDVFHNCMHNWLDYDMGLVDEKNIPKCNPECFYFDEGYCQYFQNYFENIKKEHQRNRECKINNKLK